LERVEYPQKVEKEEGPSTKEEETETTGKTQIMLIDYTTSIEFRRKPTRKANIE
jgi:hypothetical protein